LPITVGTPGSSPELNTLANKEFTASSGRALGFELAGPGDKVTLSMR
jgi:hypothetical protein